MDSIETIFGKDGVISEHMKGFRARESQIELARKVMTAIESSRHLLAEAPTGTGKSLATSIPAALQAMGGNGTVVYVTAGITLQEQLITKDMPLVAQVLNGIVFDDQNNQMPDLRYALLKGMGNYLCKINLEDTLRETREPWIKDIGEWAKKTQTGDKSELQIEYPPEQWNQVSTTAQECLKGHCPRADTCFVTKARQAALDSNLVVTNYHMWFTDLVVREATKGQFSFLPEHNIVIMDEAHEAGEIAMDFLGFQLGYPRVKWALNGLMGLGHQAEKAYSVANVAAQRFFKVLDERTGGDLKVIEEPLGIDTSLFDALMNAGFAYDEAAKQTEAGYEGGRIKQAKLESKAVIVKSLAAQVAQVTFGTLVDEEGREVFGQKGNLGRLPKDKVFYLEAEKPGDTPEIRCKAVNSYAFFQKYVFSSKTSIMTSATLTTGGTFDFIADQLGLRPDTYDTLQVDSPFAANKVLGVIPSGLSDPSDRVAHTQEIADALNYLLPRIDGGVLMLFTSHWSLQTVAGLLKKKKLDQQVTILVQGTKPKSRIIEEFKASFESKQRALILATSSFWQGVDIPGQALSVVGIDKLPFPRPDDPILWFMDESGRNTFWEYSLPKAVIAMKQGVGRLIRSEKDYGSVIFFDNRIETKGYGGQFKAALPSGCFMTDNIEDVPHFLKDMAKRRK
jgi:ATP-dependent DNA helicase DinG